MRMIVSAALLAAIAAPASAVSVIAIDTTPENSVTVWTAEPGLLEADAAIAAFTPIRLTLGRDSGETGFAFNSILDFLTGVELGKTVGTLDISLAGATFATVGSVEPAFSNHGWSLSEDLRTVTIRFHGGEGFGAQLGMESPFAIAFDDSAFGAQMTLLAGAVPEPASWALMITGFGLIGAAARTRRTRAALA